MNLRLGKFFLGLGWVEGGEGRGTSRKLVGTAQAGGLRYSYGTIRERPCLTLDVENGSVLLDEGFPPAVGTDREPFPT